MYAVGRFYTNMLNFLRGQFAFALFTLVIVGKTAPSRSRIEGMSLKIDINGEVSTAAGSVCRKIIPLATVVNPEDDSEQKSKSKQ